MMNTREMVEAFLANRQSYGCRPKTLCNYRYILQRLSRRVGTVPERPEPLEAFLAGLSMADESRHDFWRCMRTFFKWASERHGFPNPMLEVRAPRRRKRPPRSLSEMQVQRVFQGCQDRLDMALIGFSLDNGARVGETGALRRRDIMADTVWLDGKTGRREVPISPEVRRLLRSMGDGRHVWIGARGPLTRSGVEQRIRRILARAGILPPKAGPHLLRHTFGRLYIKNGGDVVRLQRIMGHASISTTMIYVQMQTQDLVDAHRSVSPVRALWVLRMAQLDETPAQTF